MSTNRKILVTGAAGFIGFHVIKTLAEQGEEVTGLDNINAYYEVTLKYDRLAQLQILQGDLEWNRIVQSRKYANLSFVRLDIADNTQMQALFAERKFTHVIHLAAQAGVRYSLVNPHAYTASNLAGFVNILECCRHGKIEHLVYASSSSVYGLNENFPSRETDVIQQPASLYAATKIANELMAHSYSHLYHIPTTGLRFFTVYGPWGRPDMAFFLFTKAIMDGKPIKIFNNGNLKRDFTYIDDIVKGILACLEIPKPTEDTPIPYRIYNIGNSDAVELMTYIETIEDIVGKKAIRDFQPMQPGDLLVTYADTSALAKDTGYTAKTGIREGLQKFIEWFREYYQYK